MSVFISYSSSDHKFARKLSTDLKSRGIKVWLDEWEIKVGDEIRQKIEYGISEYEYFIIILSIKSLSSTWVEKELNAAYMKEIKLKKIVILPVKIEECEIPILISGKKYADFTKSYSEGLKDVLQVLSRKNEVLPRKTTTNVIVVEDDLSYARSIEFALKEYGISVTTTYDPKSALHLAIDYQPEVVLFNVGHIRDGRLSRQSINAFRNLSFKIKIVGLSAFHYDSDIVELFDYIFYKPMRISELVDYIKYK